MRIISHWCWVIEGHLLRLNDVIRKKSVYLRICIRKEERLEELAYSS